MQKSELPANILDRIQKLEEKFEVMGQDLASYLDGLLYADYLKYWEYIHLDTLLSLQHPKTAFPDENIFIIYHQITELYFKLILSEIDQAIQMATPDEARFHLRIRRINNYLGHLSHSFSIMELGMDKEQFLKFRMALLPASGFQSGQFRLIEMKCTPLVNLLPVDTNPSGYLERDYEQIYWKSGASELATGKKTLTLRHFEEKYDALFIRNIQAHEGRTLDEVYRRHYQSGGSEALREEMRKLDSLANIHWRLAHYRSAVRYLQRNPEDIAATGGTNWQKYLPPQFQRISFFPSLWSEEEKKEWGKAWVLEQLGIPRSK
jgi:tryptophan 2,3-dioxygenase